MRKFGIRGFFGDPTRPDLLHAAGIDDAKTLVVAIDDPKAAVTLVQYARSTREDLHIVARANDRHHVYELYQAGANDIVREMFDSSLRAGRYVLQSMGLTEYEATMAADEFFKQDRRGLRELATLWDPEIPAIDNPEYVAKAKQLQEELATALGRVHAESFDEDVAEQLDVAEQQAKPQAD